MLNNALTIRITANEKYASKPVFRPSVPQICIDIGAPEKNKTKNSDATKNPISARSTLNSISLFLRVNMTKNDIAAKNISAINFGKL